MAYSDFNPRSPHGERRFSIDAVRGRAKFQSTLPARGATAHGNIGVTTTQFQSTLPARGATNVCLCLRTPEAHFNPRSPHGERHAIIDYQSAGFTISIHAPRTGSDYVSLQPSGKLHLFQSTLPARGATAPFPSQFLAYSDFNPRSPHGERRGMPADDDNTVRFQSTLPARGATRIKPLHRVGVEISIHAPRTGSDHGKMAKQGECFPFQSTLPARGATLSLLATFLPETNFNPRSPHGERRCCRFCTPSIPRFQSTLPARGATNRDCLPARLFSYFNPRSPHGERPPRPEAKEIESYFNPRSPHGERRARAHM